MRYKIQDLKELDKVAKIDTKWVKLIPKFPMLSMVMLGILRIPHFNTDSERVFSAVARVDTNVRPNLGNKMMQSLVVVKASMMAHKVPRFDSDFSTEFLTKAKSATYMGERDEEK